LSPSTPLGTSYPLDLKNVETYNFREITDEQIAAKKIVSFEWRNEERSQNGWDYISVVSAMNDYWVETMSS